VQRISTKKVTSGEPGIIKNRILMASDEKYKKKANKMAEEGVANNTER
jgi:hypothetical protein